MHIEIDTERMSFADGVALMGLIHMKFPTAVSALALETALRGQPGESDKVLLDLGAGNVVRTAAAEAFDDGASPPVVIPPAEEAFSPQGDAATLATSQPGDAAGGLPADASLPAGNGIPATIAASLSDVELDANGVPWDARIHSSGKTKTQANVWKKKQGVGNDTIAQVSAELKAALAAGGASPLASTTAAPAPPIQAPPAPTASPATSDAPVPAANVPQAPAASVETSPPVPPAPAPDTTTIAPSAPTAITPAAAPLDPDAIARAQAAALANPGFDEQSPAAIFTGVMTKITTAQKDGKLTPDDLTQACQGAGITSARDILKDPAKAPLLHQMLDAIIQSYG